MKRIFCGILLALAMNASALAFERGDWVLGRWDDGEFGTPVSWKAAHEAPLQFSTMMEIGLRNPQIG